MSLPEKPSLEWLRKAARRRLAELRKSNPAAKLADAQFDIAKQYGFASWRALKAHVDSLTVDGRLIEAAKSGDVRTLSEILDRHPEKLHLNVRGWTLLHDVARHGHLEAVDLLLRRGLDPNAHEEGDNTSPMHWAAANAHLDVVRRLADAGGDVIGRGDDHEWEMIGWASAQNDAAHRAVAGFLVSRGARHHIFSAIMLDDRDEVRRIVDADRSALQRRMSHNENHQTPLHFAIREKRPAIVALLVELGADPLAGDDFGFPPYVHATDPGIDRRAMEKIVATGKADLIVYLAVHDWPNAEPLLGTHPGALHLMAKRGDVEAVRWLLARGADPNARWAHWDSDLTPLHLAVLGNHAEIARVLREAGADPHIRDSKHESDAIGWAEFFGRGDLLQILR